MSKSERIQEVCANISAIGSATTMSGFAFGTVWYVGGIVFDKAKEWFERRKEAKKVKQIDEEWEEYKQNLDRMIEENRELLAKTEQEIEG